MKKKGLVHQSSIRPCDKYLDLPKVIIYSCLRSIQETFSSRLGLSPSSSSPTGYVFSLPAHCRGGRRLLQPWVMHVRSLAARRRGRLLLLPGLARARVCCCLSQLPRVRQPAGAIWLSIILCDLRVIESPCNCFTLLLRVALVVVAIVGGQPW